MDERSATKSTTGGFDTETNDADVDANAPDGEEGSTSSLDVNDELLGTLAEVER